MIKIEENLTVTVDVPVSVNIQLSCEKCGIEIDPQHTGGNKWVVKPHKCKKGENKTIPHKGDIALWEK